MNRLHGSVGRHYVGGLECIVHEGGCAIRKWECRQGGWRREQGEGSIEEGNLFAMLIRCVFLRRFLSRK